MKQVLLPAPSRGALAIQWAGVITILGLLSTDLLLVAQGWLSPSIATFRLADAVSGAALATTVGVAWVGRRYPTRAFLLSADSIKILGLPPRLRVPRSSVESVEWTRAGKPVLRLRSARTPLDELFATFLLSPSQASEIGKWMHAAGTPS